jgi:hypothetical protein
MTTIRKVLQDRQASWEEARSLMERTPVRDLLEPVSASVFEEDEPIESSSQRRRRERHSRYWQIRQRGLGR